MIVCSAIPVRCHFHQGDWLTKELASDFSCEVKWDVGSVSLNRNELMQHIREEIKEVDSRKILGPSLLHVPL